MALTAKPQQGRNAAIGVLAMLALVLALGVAGLRSAAQLAAAGQQMQRHQAALTALASLQATANALRDAGDGVQRDLPAAGVQRDLAAARAAADAQMAALRQLLATDAEQFSRLVPLGTALAARFDAMAAPAEPRRRAPQTTQPPAAGATTGDARRLHDAVQAAVLQLQGPAQAALAAAQQSHTAAAGRAALWWWLSGAAALLLVAGLAWAAWRLLQALSAARAAAATADAQQQARQADLQHVLTVAPEPICLLDADARVVRANPACLRLWGRSGDDTARGTPFVDTVLPDDRRRAQLALDQLFAGAASPSSSDVSNASDFSHRVQQADGSIAVIRWHAQWSAADGTLVCAGRDVTELQALRGQAAQQAQTLAQRGADIAAATARAQQADAVQARFLSTLGPALAEPVDAACSMAGVLLQGLSGPLAPEQRRQLQQLQTAAQQVQAAVHDLLALASIDAGALVLEREPFDLWEALQQVATAVRPRALDKGLALQLELADNLGYARGDERQLQQVLTRLLDNAIRCTAAGSVTLAARPLEGGLLAISVADTGRGIAAADVGRLFEAFHQREEAADTQARGQRSGGVGLGLAIAQRLARLMGGSIAVASRPGHGSTFTLTLPSDAAVSGARS